MSRFKRNKHYMNITGDGMKYMMIVEYCYETHIYGYPYKMEGIELTNEGLLILKSGFRTNGASGPTIDCEHNQRAAFVHDALYELLRLMVLPDYHRKTADKIFKQILKEDGMNWIRRQYFYWGVRIFGGNHI